VQEGYGFVTFESLEDAARVPKKMIVQGISFLCSLTHKHNPMTMFSINNTNNKTQHKHQNQIHGGTGCSFSASIGSSNNNVVNNLSGKSVSGSVDVNSLSRSSFCSFLSFNARYGPLSSASSCINPTYSLTNIIDLSNSDCGSMVSPSFSDKLLTSLGNEFRSDLDGGASNNMYDIKF
jgi:hypothetical protein